MTKKDLIEVVAQSQEITKKQSEEILETLLGTITESLTKGEKVSIAGFGNFEVRERAARKGRNPKTGETIDIASSKSVGFKAAKALKEQV